MATANNFQSASIPVVLLVVARGVRISSEEVEKVVEPTSFCRAQSQIVA